MEQKGVYKYALDSRDVDYKGTATFTAMVHYILEAAGDDADCNGFGVRDLNYNNCTWVLSRMSAEFYRWPAQGCAFTVRTWVNDVNRLMTTRNMEVTCEGEKIAAAITQWAIIDLDKRTALDIREQIDYANKVTDEPSPIARPARIGQVSPHQTATHKVAYSDIDFNRHMNTLRYLTVMYDMLPEEYFDRRELARADINFIHEARYGQQLTVAYQQSEQSLFEVSDQNGRALCRLALHWK